MKMVFVFLVGIFVGQFMVRASHAATDGWTTYEINQVINLLEQIARNTAN